jgi:hypothetical protein
MPQPTFHPSVNARVNKLGKEYEKLQTAAFRTMKDIPAFSDRIGPSLQQFMDYNDQIVHLLNEEKIPEHLLKHQIETSDAMAALGKRFNPMFSDLVYGSRPKLDRILKYGDTLTRELHTLHDLRLHQEASETLTAKLEKETEALTHLHTEVRQLLNACISAFQEIQNILKRSLN